MKEIDKMEKGALIDMLASRTAEYTNKLTNNQRGEDFNDCGEQLFDLQTEIRYREEGQKSQDQQKSA